MQAILHVDEQAMDSTMASLLRRKLYGLKPGNVLLLPIPRYCGYKASEHTALMLEPDWQSEHRPAGSGIAMLSCGWSRFAYTCAQVATTEQRPAGPIPLKLAAQAIKVS